MQRTKRSNGVEVSLFLRVITLDLAFINMRDKGLLTANCYAPEKGKFIVADCISGLERSIAGRLDGCSWA